MADSPVNTTPFFPLRDVLPDVVDRLQKLLTEAGEHELAAAVPGLQVFDRCRCGADHCATVYTLPKPNGAYGDGHRNIAFWPKDVINVETGERLQGQPAAEYMTILDVIPEGIACIEILYGAESRCRLVAALPDVEP
jgi:hypothetical protein